MIKRGIEINKKQVERKISVQAIFDNAYPTNLGFTLIFKSHNFSLNYLLKIGLYLQIIFLSVHKLFIIN